jgi:hypothetical protein
MDDNLKNLINNLKNKLVVPIKRSYLTPDLIILECINKNLSLSESVNKLAHDLGLTLSDALRVYYDFIPIDTTEGRIPTDYDTLGYHVNYYKNLGYSPMEIRQRISKSFIDLQLADIYHYYF